MSKIIKLAAFALIGYGVYKAFFADNNDVGDYSSTAANSGSTSQQSGYKSASVTAANSDSTSQQSGYKPASVVV